MKISRRSCACGLKRPISGGLRIFQKNAPQNLIIPNPRFTIGAVEVIHKETNLDGETSKLFKEKIKNGK